MLIDEIEELNDTLYKAFGKLRENSDNINDVSHKRSVADKIMELYELDYKLIYGKFTAEEKHAAELDIERTTRKSELERRKRELTPRIRRPWYLLFLVRFRNRAEEITEREVSANVARFLGHRESAVTAVERMLEAADNADVAETLGEDNNEVSCGKTVDIKNL